MRTTVTLDADAAALVDRAMRERGLSFKEAVNLAIRLGLGEPDDATFSTPTYAMGHPAHVNLDKATSLGSELDDANLVARLSQGR